MRREVRIEERLTPSASRLNGLFPIMGTSQGRESQSRPRDDEEASKKRRWVPAVLMLAPVSCPARWL
ncbi:hypothetical protein MRX96_016930 [Rhipicephalus microplus]